MLGIINRRISYKLSEIISKLYRSYVRLYLRVLYTAWGIDKCERCRYVKGVSEKSSQSDYKFKKLVIWGKIEKAGYVSFKA